MSLRCRRPNRSGTVKLSLAAVALAATVRAQPLSDLPATESGPLSVAVTTLFPGGGSPPPESPLVKAYQGNLQYISEGRRLFTWYNCYGCHANGGGGVGPRNAAEQVRGAGIASGLMVLLGSAAYEGGSPEEAVRATVESVRPNSVAESA